MLLSEKTLKSIHLLHRLAAIFYDALLLIAVLFFAVVIAYPVLSIVGLTDVNKIGQHHPVIHFAFQLYLLAVCYFYFAWPWQRGGQTLGLQVWRAKLVSLDEQPVTHKRLLIRFLMSIVSWAVLGLGFIWSLFDAQHLTWHDRASKTILIKRPPKK